MRVIAPTGFDQFYHYVRIGAKRPDNAILLNLTTICPRSLVHFYVGTHCIKIEKNRLDIIMVLILDGR